MTGAAATGRLAGHPDPPPPPAAEPAAPQAAAPRRLFLAAAEFIGLHHTEERLGDPARRIAAAHAQIADSGTYRLREAHPRRPHPGAHHGPRPG